MADHHEHEHEEAHVGPNVHLPDPSVWPLIVGVAFFLVGTALVWWARDPDNAFTGPLVGAAAVVALVSAAGWAYEDGRMKKQAEEGDHGHTPGEARYTQVISFAIVEGQFETANSDQGVLHKVNAADSELRNLAGFQDLRINASPAETGPSQVLVETTWADREGLATYDETRQTVLDIVNEFQDQVVPGSVQVFDMMVVRDTKDVAVRFGMGTAATLIGGLAIGGFLIGAGMTLFEADPAPVADENDDVAPAPDGFEQTGILEANDNFWEPDEIRLPPNTEVTITIDNVGMALHNLQIFETAEPGDGDLLTGCIEGCDDGTEDVHSQMVSGGEQLTFTFTTPDEGEYGFWCLPHSSEMQGTLIVEEGAPVPGEAPPVDDNDVPGEGIIHLDDENGSNFFEPDQLTLPPDTEVTLTARNVGSVVHNFELWDSETPGDGSYQTGCVDGCDDPEEVRIPLVQAGDEVTFTFITPAEEGDYGFWCLPHQSDMRGVLTIEEGAPGPGGNGDNGEDGAEDEGDAEAEGENAETTAWSIVR